MVSYFKVFAASRENNTVYALDANTGEECWRYVAGGRVDSSPSCADGRVIFGAADGYVTCLRESDGALIWRFRAAQSSHHSCCIRKASSSGTCSGISFAAVTLPGTLPAGGL